MMKKLRVARGKLWLFELFEFDEIVLEMHKQSYLPNVYIIDDNEFLSKELAIHVLKSIYTLMKNEELMKKNFL